MNLNISKLLLIPLKSKCTDKIASLFQVIFMEFSFCLKGFMTGPYIDLNLRENNSILITIYIKQELCAFSWLYWLHDDFFACMGFVHYTMVTRCMCPLPKHVLLMPFHFPCFGNILQFNILWFAKHLTCRFLPTVQLAQICNLDFEYAIS